MLFIVDCQWVGVRGGERGSALYYSGIQADGTDAVWNVASCHAEGKERVPEDFSSRGLSDTAPPNHMEPKEQSYQVPQRGDPHHGVGHLGCLWLQVMDSLNQARINHEGISYFTALRM